MGPPLPPVVGRWRRFATVTRSATGPSTWPSGSTWTRRGRPGRVKHVLGIGSKLPRGRGSGPGCADLRIPRKEFGAACATCSSSAATGSPASLRPWRRPGIRPRYRPARCLMPSAGLRRGCRCPVAGQGASDGPGRHIRWPAGRFRAPRRHRRGGSLQPLGNDPGPVSRQPRVAPADGRGPQPTQPSPPACPPPPAGRRPTSARDPANGLKQRIHRLPDGRPRLNCHAALLAVRSFYLDLRQWSMEDPARWAP